MLTRDQQGVVILLAALVLGPALWPAAQDVPPTAAPARQAGVPEEQPPPAATIPASAPHIPAAPKASGDARPTAMPEPLVGVASWFRYRPGEAAAGPKLRAFLGPNWRGQTVKVCASDCLFVVISSWCQCYRGTPDERIIDLDRTDFAKLRKPSAGLVRVVLFR